MPKTNSSACSLLWVSFILAMFLRMMWQISVSDKFLVSFDCFFIIELYLFFIECSLLRSLSFLTSEAHFFPFSKTWSKSSWSYSKVQLDLLFDGSRWLNHLYLHCLEDRRKVLQEVTNRILAISFHLEFSELWMMDDNMASSSIDHFPNFPSSSRRLQAWYSKRLYSLV